MDLIIFTGYEAAASAIPLAAMLAAHKKRKKKTNTADRRPPYLPVIIFALYIMGVMHFTGLTTVYELMRTPFMIHPEDINLAPFSNQIDINAYILNVFMLMPLGFLAPLLCEKARSPAVTVLLGAGLSLFIESVQLFNERRTDIDDFIMNTLGALTGFLLFRVFDSMTESKLRSNTLTCTKMCLITLAMFAGRFLLYNELGLAGALYGF